LIVTVRFFMSMKKSSSRVVSTVMVAGGSANLYFGLFAGMTGLTRISGRSGASKNL